MPRVSASADLARLARALVLAALATAACGPLGPGALGEPEPLLPGEAPFTPGSAELPPFRIDWQGSDWDDAQLRVTHAARVDDTLLESEPGYGFVAAGRGEESVRETRGSFRVKDRIARRCVRQRVESFRAEPTRVRLAGELVCEPEGDSVPWELVFTAAGERQLRFQLTVGGGANRSQLVFSSDPDERIFGFGEQFSFVDLKGLRVPILVQEQGIGRGRQPLTWLVDRVAASGGSWHSSYAPVPHALTSRLRSIFLENTEYAAFDLRDPFLFVVDGFSASLVGRVIHGESPLDLVREYTSYAGRMRPLPAWVHRGAIVGLQGGTARVYEALDRLSELETPLAAFWLQDWVGRRDTEFGQQLWWSWELDRDRYPDWEKLVADLEAAGVRVMTYVNPFVVDTRNKPNRRRDFLNEAHRGGYLVQRENGRPYFTRITSFQAALVDLSNPAARDWMAQVIREEVLGVGASGWMADFGEALPWDGVVRAEQGAPALHNRYPELWAELNRRAIDEAGRGDDVVFFTRSGFTRSPAASTLFWLGDQLVSWDEHDGIKSAVTGLLSGGFSGFAFNHSDLGGYTTIDRPLVGVRRERQLLLRWIELGAFQVVFRTHEGNLPALNHQFDSDDLTLQHFSRFAKVHDAWGFYREELIREAAATGAPVVRHPFLLYPDEPRAQLIRFEQFFVGRELLVVPSLDRGRTRLRAWLPPGRWVHVWSGEVYGDAQRSLEVRVLAPLGEPAVFYKEGSAVGERFRENLARWGLLSAGSPP